MAYTRVLFDLDGTLTESGPGVTGAVQYALQKLGIEEPDRSKLEVFIGPPLNISFQEFYHLTAEETQLAVHYFREVYDSKMIFENQLYPGVRELLKQLHTDGVQLAIASSKPDAMVHKVLNYFDIEADFDVIVGSADDEEEDGKAGKDNKQRMVEKALAQLRELNADGSDEAAFCEGTAMVGDRCFDIKGAKANHVAAIGVSYGYGSRKELTESGADAIAADTKELYEILRR